MYMGEFTHNQEISKIKNPIVRRAILEKCVDIYSYKNNLTDQIIASFCEYFIRTPLCCVNLNSYADSDYVLNAVSSENNCLLLINTALRREKEGEHWLVYDVKRQDFFDGKGDKPSHYKKGGIWALPAKTYNHCKYQSERSSSCGHLCCAYMLSKTKNISIEDIVGRKTPKTENDREDFDRAVMAW